MLARDIMSSPALTVTAGTHIPEVARLLRAHQISGMPVVDGDGHLLGIVTDHDLILRNAPVREPRYFAVLSGLIPLNLEEYRHYKDQLRHTMAVTAGDLTEPDFHVIAADTPLEEAMQLMLDPKVTILPVVEGDQVVGVVTRTDLVRLVERLEGALDPSAQETAIEERALSGLIEVILYIQAMQPMVVFYRDQLGWDVETPADLADYSEVEWVVLDTGACKLALHSGGARRQGEDAPMLVFGVANIDQSRAALLERGVALDEIFEAAPGIRVCHFVDPEGNRLALEERG